MSIKQNVSQKVKEQAADYIAKLYSGELTEEDEMAIYHWLDEDDDHKREYQLQLELWEFASNLVTTLEQVDFEDNLPKIKNKFFNRYASLAATALLTIMLLAMNFMPNNDPTPIVYKTDVGDVERIILSDNSVITLNTNSEIVVTLTDDIRKVSLVSGEAFFDVTPNKNRPFIVETEYQQIKVVGTKFNVHKVFSSIEVAVTEGLVQVQQNFVKQSADKTKLIEQNKYLLEKGNLGTFSASVEVIIPITSTEINNRTSWKNGLLTFENETLQTVITELNRYRHDKIELRGVGIRKLKISGVFDFKQEKGVIAGLSKTLPIDVSYEEHRVILRSKNSNN